jgi:hypothetical protein
VVLGDGTLWTALPVHTSRSDCQESITTVLERSKRAVLDVSVVCDDDTDSPHEAIFSKISQNFNRIKSLHFATTTPRMLRVLSVPALKLEVLNIYTAEQSAELGFLFGGNLPALRSLTLAGFPSWPPGLFSNLKDLHLILPPSYPTVRISSLIDVMSRSPGIELIKMSAFLSVTDDSPPSLLVRLPNLQKFTMRDCDSATVLSHASIPPKADVKVVMDHCTMGVTMGIPSLDHHILSSLPEDASAVGFLTESTMVALQQGGKSGFGIGFYRSHSSQPSLRILDRSPSADSFARQSIEALANHPHYFRNITDLSIVSCLGARMPWPTLLRRFKRLERLSMAAPHAPSILSALMVTGGDSNPICPALNHLSIHEKGEGHTTTFDRDNMIEFSVARRVLNCAVAIVDIHGSDGMKRWKCGSCQTVARN